MYSLNYNTITRIDLDRSDNINRKEVIYPMFFLEYPKTSTYGIAHIISVYKKSQKDIQLLFKNIVYFHLFFKYFKINIV